jgi:hypothetical protein
MFGTLARNAWPVIVAVSVGVLPLVADRAAATERPFEARWDGNAHLSDTEIPWITRNDETGEGEATHLGLFTWESVEYVDFSNFPVTISVTGQFVMTAADGDRVYGTYETVGIPDLENGRLLIQGTFHVTGGTGRFAGASGGGELDAIAYLSEGLPFTGHYRGTINY